MRITLITAVAAAGLTAGSALAQQPPGDAARGHALAKTWCSSCHQIEAHEMTAKDAVPSLASVAAMKSTTALSLQAFLQTPHGNMPDWRLTRQQIDDVVAYILTLRGGAT